MDRFERIAEMIVAQNEAFDLDDMTMAVASFFDENPNPNDDKFHKWAEGKGYNVHKAEASAYELGTLAASFLLHGRSVEKKMKAKDVDVYELKMGIKVEMEHTSSKQIAERISLDHLAEIDSPLGYYTGLKLLERFMEKLAAMDVGAANEKIRQFEEIVG